MSRVTRRRPASLGTWVGLRSFLRLLLRFSFFRRLGDRDRRLFFARFRSPSDSSSVALLLLVATPGDLHPGVDGRAVRNGSIQWARSSPWTAPLSMFNPRRTS